VSMSFIYNEQCPTNICMYICVLIFFCSNLMYKFSTRECRALLPTSCTMLIVYINIFDFQVNYYNKYKYFTFASGSHFFAFSYSRGIIDHYASNIFY
jgi:hypothetical protein